MLSYNTPGEFRGHVFQLVSVEEHLSVRKKKYFYMSCIEDAKEGSMNVKNQTVVVKYKESGTPTQRDWIARLTH